MKTKICTKCHRSKSIECYTNDKTKKDGLYSSCKGCNRKTRGSKKFNPRKKIVNGLILYRCSKCKKRKERESFYCNPSNKKDGIHSECKKCSILRSNTELQRTKRKGWHQVTRMQILFHYSGGTPKCACCDENRNEFLCLDHINGGGGKHRKSIGNGHFFKWIKSNGFPKGYRVLCHNCNLSLGFYGYCPHKDETNKQEK